jgi:hypothetical protein
MSRVQEVSSNLIDDANRVYELSATCHSCGSGDLECSGCFMVKVAEHAYECAKYGRAYDGDLKAQLRSMIK